MADVTSATGRAEKSRTVDGSEMGCAFRFWATVTIGLASG